MKYEMVWKDGRRESTEHGGGLAIITTIRENGRCIQVTFRLNETAPHGVMEYVEAERKDVTERMREAEQRNRERTMDYMRKGWQYDEDMAAKDAEIARLRALLGSG